MAARIKAFLSSLSRLQKGLLFLGLILLLGWLKFMRDDFTRREQSSTASSKTVDATPRAGAERAEADRLQRVLQDAPKLLATARAAQQPEIILRNACQVPVGSPQYRLALREIERAERIWDQTFMRGERKAIAARLQDLYYRQGMKIECAAIEGKQPTLRLRNIAFGATTAYQADDILDANTKNHIARLGFQRMVWEDGYGGSSILNWKPEDVKVAQFAWVRRLCDRVLTGSKSPDEITAASMSRPD